MAFIEPMHRNKPNITYLLTCKAKYCELDADDFITSVQENGDLLVIPIQEIIWQNEYLFRLSPYHRILQKVVHGHEMGGYQIES